MVSNDKYLEHSILVHLVKEKDTMVQSDVNPYNFEYIVLS